MTSQQHRRRPDNVAATLKQGRVLTGLACWVQFIKGLKTDFNFLFPIKREELSYIEVRNIKFQLLLISIRNRFNVLPTVDRSGRS